VCVIEPGRVDLTRARRETAADDPFSTFSAWEGMPGYDVWDFVMVP
jgi:hypothetical protein